MNELNPKELLGRVVDKAADILQYGSYAQRNPLLGKMVRCPFCRIRRRMRAAEICCNPKYVKGTEGTGVPKKKGRAVPRLTRHSPPLFQMRQLLLAIEANPEIAVGMQAEMLSRRGFIPRQIIEDREDGWITFEENLIAPEQMAIFVERYLNWKGQRQRRRARTQQKISRQINRRTA